ncbi:MAG TPA: PKD domain-containing protein [Flavipsychrobacter sp.]|nr:PKD domain-containing protein [Flavipsychrobacter sp.]
MKRIIRAFLSFIALLYAVSIIAQPVANFTVSTKSGCAPLVGVLFTDASTGNPTSWSWTFSPGSPATGTAITRNFITPGTYIVTLTVSNANGTSSKSDTITVYPNPTVNFSANNPAPSCAPKTVTFSDQSTLGAPGTPSYFWDFGDGNTSTAASPTHTYVTPGSYTVTLNVISGAGCSGFTTKSNYITVTNAPTPNFTSNVTGSCNPPLTVNFTNTSTGGPTSYFWDFGNGVTSTAANPPPVTYTTTGSFNVSLRVSAAGCADTLIKPSYISIGALTASYTQNPSSICTGHPVNFTNTSTPGPGTSTWYFGDGNSFVGTNASHAYAAPGTYNTMLIVNYNNCSDTATNTVVVTPGPNTQFTSSSSVGCTAPFSTTFTNTTTGAVSYVWNFGDGSAPVATTSNASQTHTYQNFGNYTVTLIATSANGCVDTFTLPLSVIQTVMNVVPSPQSACEATTISFSTSVVPNVPITSYIWNFGDGSGPSLGGASNSHFYSTSGTYPVTVTYTTASGCTFNSLPSSVTLSSKPNAAFTFAPDSVCPKTPVTFTDNSSGGSMHIWNYGNGVTAVNPSFPVHTYKYPSYGLYTVSLVISNGGCSDTAFANVYIKYPAAEIILNHSCTNKNVVSFIDSSKSSPLPSNPAVSSPLNYYLDFGDGTPTLITTGTPPINIPTHTYPVLTAATNYMAQYALQLMVIDPITACTSTTLKPVVLYDLQPQFTADDTAICANQTVNFTGSYQPYQIAIDHVDWYFGDGGSLTNAGLTCSHTYTAPGKYTVTMILTDGRGCKDTAVRTQYITVGSPIAKFGASPPVGCAPLLVHFLDSTLANGSGIASVLWRFGDGSPNSGQQNPTHTYLAAGAYSVTLVVTDSAGCFDSLTKTNYIKVYKPVAAFSTNDTFICPGNTATFTNQSTGSISNYDWDFGDNTPHVNTVSPTHLYTTVGTYTVRLVAIDSAGCSDTVRKTITVSGLNLSFTASDTAALCPPLIVTFINTSVGVGAIQWDLGNGNTSINDTAQTIYTMPGTYTVKLKGFNGLGCQDSIMKTITIGGAASTLTYTPKNGCTPLTVTFTATAAGAQNFIWDMDNGFTDTTTVGTYTYAYTDTGRFIPRVILSDGQCVIAVQGMDTIISERVNADFRFLPDSICQNGSLQFFDTTLQAYNPITTRRWSFGDGGTDTVHNPTHFYNTPGTFNVTLVIGSSQGCTDTISKSVRVLAAPVLTTPSDSLCLGQTVAHLQASGATNYAWSPSAGLSCTNCSSPTASPTTTTTYTVIGTATNGCKDTNQVTVKVNPLPVVSAGPPQSVCGGVAVPLNPTGASNYTWSPSSGLSCTNCTSPMASPSAKTTYIVTGTDANGCTDTGIVVVSVGPKPNVTTTPSAPVCAGGSMTLTATGAQSYTWSPVAGLSCVNCPNPTATPAATTTYVVTGVDTIGCTDTGVVTVTVNPNPVVNAGNNQAMCLGLPIQLQATGAASYSWTPATGLSCTTCPNPIVSATVTTTYILTGMSANGCSDTDHIVITVNQPPAISVITPQPACAGSSVPLQATGAQSYSWSPSAGLSCVNCSNPNASPGSTTTYTVVGTDVNGCKDTAQVTVTIHPLPNIDAGPDRAICNQKTTQLNASGGTSYTWSPANDLTCSTCPNPVASPRMTTTYRLNGTDQNGCSNSDSVIVTVLPLPTVNAGEDKTICEGKSVNLLASGASSYAWSPNISLSCSNCPGPIASPSDTITYTVIGTDANGCNDTDEVIVNVIEKRPVYIGPGDSLCKGESFQLKASGGDSYLWTPGTYLDNPNKADPMVTAPEETIWYKVLIKQGYCFVDSGMVNVAVYPNPTVYAGEDQSIASGTSVMLYANTLNATEYLWTPSSSLTCEDCQNPTATPAATTTYVVTVSNKYGCIAKDDVTIRVLCDKNIIFTANVFTPNGDGLNDRFYPQGSGIDIVRSFRIYNRWGELMYEARNIKINDESVGWDGTYKGQALPPDVYVYVIDAVCLSGSAVQKKGDISINK